jgi:hypothetical protein
VYLRGTFMVENKGVPDRNIGVLLVCKYANYHTLSSLSLSSSLLLLLL